MTTYSLIVKNIIKTEFNFFINYKPDNVNGIFKLLFSLLLKKEINIKNKFQFFNEGLENFLIKNSKNNRDKEFINYFCKIQKTYNILNKFLYNYKYKKAKLVVTTDMGLNELTIYDKNVICILHNNSKYLFHINDLIKIINTALTNSHMFFSEPKSIKNPYDNVPFNKSTLYNIYFFIKHKTNYYPELFLKFFNVDFNLTIFKNNNEYLLRNYSINNYVYKSPQNILINEINNMIYFFNDYCKDYELSNEINISIEFPKDKLIKIMRPYLLMYFISNYGYLKQDRKIALFFFKKELIKFNNFNPQFGRKKYKFLITYTPEFKKKICKIIEFDDRHIQFNNIEKQNKDFLSDHLKYTETTISNVFIFNVINEPQGPQDGVTEDDHEEDDEDDDDDDDDDDDEEDVEEDDYNNYEHQEEDEDSIS